MQIQRAKQPAGPKTAKTRAAATLAPALHTQDLVDALLSAHGLRRTGAARQVLGWLLDTSYTHTQRQTTLVEHGSLELDRVTLYRLIDRLAQVGILLCRVHANGVRRYQAMPASVRALPHFECQSCHLHRPLAGALQRNADTLEHAAQTAFKALQALGYQGLSMDFAVRGFCADCVGAQPGQSA